MTEYDEALEALEAVTAPLFAEVRRRNRVLFQHFYPKLTDEEIANSLRLHGVFDDTDIRTIQVFYRTTSYAETIKEPGTCTGQGGVRARVLRALRKLPEHTPLHEALTMAYKHLNALK